MSEMELFSRIALYGQDGDKVLISGVTANGTVFKDQCISLANNNYYPTDVDNFRKTNLKTSTNPSSKNITAFFNRGVAQNTLRIMGQIEEFPYQINMCASPNLDEYLETWCKDFHMGILITQMKTLDGQVLYESSIDINDETVIERIQKKKMKAVLSLYGDTNRDINYEQAISFAADVTMALRYMQIMQDKPFAQVEYVFNNARRDDVHMGFYKKERENNSIAILYADDYIGFDPYYNRQANMADSLLVNGEEVMKPSLEKSKLIESYIESRLSTDELMHLFDHYFEDEQKDISYTKK